VNYAEIDYFVGDFVVVCGETWEICGQDVELALFPRSGKSEEGI
jgi:hypothetical protein